MNIFPVHTGRLYRLGSKVCRICPEIHSYHNYTLVASKMSMIEMQAEYTLGISADEERSEGLQLALGNPRLTTVIFEAIVPKIGKRE